MSSLHPRLMYLPLLLISPVQHAVTQQGPLFRAGDVKDWQLSVNQGVTCGLLAWLFVGHHWLWWCIFAPVFLRLLGSSPLPSSSRPRFLPLGLLTFSLLVLGPSPPRALPVVFFLAALVPSASSGPLSSVESSSP